MQRDDISPLLIAALASSVGANVQFQHTPEGATMDRPLTTADVPPRFLKDAYFVGHVPHKALTSDPRVSYSLYVPPQLYNPDPSNGQSTLPKLPLLVYIHGTKRNISAIYGDLEAFADQTPCAILAPLFPMGMEGPNDLNSYKILNSGTLRSDLALLSILDEIADRWPGIETEKVFMMGFSGGGQFAHRFLYLYPERLAAVSIGAPNFVTQLDEHQKWTNGIADVSQLFDGVTVSKLAIAQVRIQLVVGSEDNKVHGSEEFWVWLRSIKGNKIEEIHNLQQGRLDTLAVLQHAWSTDGIDCQFDVVEGAGHDSSGAIRSRTLAFLQSCMRG